MAIRSARASDLDTIIRFIRELAIYEREPDAVVLDRSELARHLFGETPRAEVLLAETEAGEAVGFALFFHNFSTWLGKPGAFIEDLFVLPEHRGSGYGKALFSEVARLAVRRGCGRLEWAVLDWNQPAIDFYLALGGKPMSEWTTFRLTGEALTSLAAERSPRIGG